MFLTSSFIDSMIMAINNTLRPKNATAIKGFDTKELPIPIKSIFFSFVPEKNSVTYFEDENKEYCQKNEATVKMTCYAPITSLASDIHELTESVLDFINDRFVLEFTGYTIGTIEYDSDVKAYKIPCRIFYETSRCAADGSTSQTVTVPANFFCKTHVTDTDIHVTAQEHARISSPFIVGTYIGQGYGSPNPIFLDFTPSIVLVFRQSFPFTVYDAENELTVNYAGIAVKGHHSKGISISTETFSVLDTESFPTETRLNEYGATYVYIAVR